MVQFPRSASRALCVASRVCLHLNCSTFAAWKGWSLWYFHVRIFIIWFPSSSTSWLQGLGPLKSDVQSVRANLYTSNYFYEFLNTSILYTHTLQDIYIATQNYQRILWLFWIISDHFWSSACQYALSLTIVSGSYWQISIGARFEWIVAQEICWNKPHETKGSAGKEAVNSRAREDILPTLFEWPW